MSSSRRPSCRELHGDHGCPRPAAGSPYVALAASTAPTALVSTAPPAAATVSPTSNLVINEVYGGGGNSGGASTRTSSSCSTAVHPPPSTSASSTRCSTRRAPALPSAGNTATPWSGTIQPGGHLLVGEAFGTNLALADMSSPTSTAPSPSPAPAARSPWSRAPPPSPPAAALPAPALSNDFVGWGSAATGYAGSARQAPARPT